MVAVEVDGIGRLENHVVELDRDLVPVGEQPAVIGATRCTSRWRCHEDEAERQAGALE